VDVVGYRLLVNGLAGDVDDDAVEAAREVLASERVAVSATSSVEELDEVLADLPERWAAVVCGGDGSVHLAVQRLRHLGRPEVPVGLVALGTGNDLARGLGLPLEDPAAAARRIRDGRPRALDLLVDDHGTVCVNALHVGLGATAADRAAALKPALARLAYPVAALLSGLADENVPARVVVDGQPWSDDETLLVALCNGPSFGGGTRMAPSADPGDGWVDVVVVTAVRRADRASFGLALQRGDHLDRADVRHGRGREVTIRMAGASYAVDGEIEPAWETPRTWRLAPGAWTLLA
jgi:diacylglycerol kinase family enzyme